MNLVEALATPPAPNAVQREKAEIPKLGDPSTYEWNGTEGVINTPPTVANVSTWDEYIKDAGLDPTEIEVIEPVQVRGWDSVKREWDADLGDFVSNVVRMHYYRLTLRRKRSGLAIDDLLAIASKAKKPSVQSSGDFTFVVAIGDLQIGKMDGDGVEGTVRRATEGILGAAERLKSIRKYKSIGTVHIAWLGDCIEGFVSQGGMNSWRTPLSLTEQIRILRRLMLFAVETFAPLAQTVSVVAVPGNHDQAVRFGKNGVTTYSDSFDVEAVLAVSDACRLSGKFGNAVFHVPERDELTVTLETSGTILGHIHGHQTRARKHFEWWSKQSFGDQPIGQADILMAGHFHHFILDTSGKRKFIQVPALESESTWYRHQNGEVGDPGVLTFVTANGQINNIEIV